jgi:pimeloyl-ACP methyl ester carboxylesterase
MADAMQVGFRTVDGVRVRCAESTGPSAPSILLTSPWPESAYAFAPIWPSLANVARLVPVDLPGFGRSERRDDLLSPRAMGEFLVRLVAEWGLEKPHVVAPDIGTSAALFAAASRPGLLSSVVVGSGGASVPIQLSGPLAEWVLAPDLDGFRAIGPRAIGRRRRSARITSSIRGRSVRGVDALHARLPERASPAGRASP